MKFSIVTPTFNSEAFISETIESILCQKGDFDIEHIVMDNESSDRTQEIVRQYSEEIENGQRKIHCRSVRIVLCVRSDAGMYDAIEHGLAMATGDVYAWLNSDDVYLPGALSTVHRVFSEFEQVSWISGVCGVMDGNSTIFSRGNFKLFCRPWLQKGLYGPALYGVNQESVFWRKRVWDEASEGIGRFRLAGDYFLWCRFARRYDLYSLDALLSCFRRVKDQKSEDMDAYWNEAASFLPVSRHYIMAARAIRMLAKFFPPRLSRFVFPMFYPRNSIRIISPGRRGNMEFRIYENRVPGHHVPGEWV